MRKYRVCVHSAWRGSKFVFHARIWVVGKTTTHRCVSDILWYQTLLHHIYTSITMLGYATPTTLVQWVRLYRLIYVSGLLLGYFGGILAWPEILFQTKSNGTAYVSLNITHGVHLVCDVIKVHVYRWKTDLQFSKFSVFKHFLKICGVRSSITILAWSY